MNRIECPYCESDVELDDDFELEDEEELEQYCPYCKKTFLFHVAGYTIDFSSRKADCLNGGEHDFRKMYTLPVFGSVMFKCSVCKQLKKEMQNMKGTYRRSY